MHVPLYVNDMAQVAHDRIHDMYVTKAELRAARLAACERVGLVTRTRGWLGRRLVSIGSTVAGQQHA